MKADGEIIIFAGQGEYLDRSGYEAEWSLDGNILEVVWVDQPRQGDSTTAFAQSGRVSIEDDGAYMWLRWTSLTVNGEAESPPDTCILLIDANEVSNIPAYVDFAEQNVGRAPSWCID